MDVIRANDSRRDNRIEALSDERCSARNAEPSVGKTYGDEGDEKGRKFSRDHLEWKQCLSEKMLKNGALDARFINLC